VQNTCRGGALTMGGGTVMESTVTVDTKVVLQHADLVW
jgi:hypothetical protein